MGFLHHSRNNSFLWCQTLSFNAILTLCSPGDEVLLPKPYWVTYLEQIKLAQGKPVLLEPSPSTLTVSIEEIKKLSPHTRLIIINNPSNRQGGMGRGRTRRNSPVS